FPYTTLFRSAFIYNRVDFTGDEPIYAWGRSPEVRHKLLAAYPNRPVWIIDGPSITGDSYKVIAGPLTTEHPLLADGGKLIPDGRPTDGKTPDSKGQGDGAEDGMGDSGGAEATAKGTAGKDTAQKGTAGKDTAQKDAAAAIPSWVTTGVFHWEGGPS